MNRRNLALAAIIGGAVLMTTACRININSGGEIVTRTFDITEFDELEVSSAFDVVVEIGDEPSLEIDIDEEVADRLDVDQDDDRLRIGFDGGLFSVSGPLEIRVTTTELTKVTFDGAVDAEINGLDTERFEVELNGASQVTGHGSVDVLVIDADGASSADFSETAADLAEVDANGASSIDVTGAKEVTGEAGGASSVDVSPNANQNVSTSGASSVD